TLDTLNGLYLDDNLIATGLMQPTQIANYNNNKKELLKIVDALGRETFPRKNTTLFYIYNNGIVEKRIIIE
ncbi:MAG: hypothetical protein ACKVG7_05130, partial [Flavobacteriales bacterium]